MNRTMALGAALILVLILSSCGTYKYHSHTEPRFLLDDALLKLNATRPVAIKNVSSAVSGTEEILCGFGTWRIMGSLYDFTESAIGTAKDALQKQHITINNNADKTLELLVYKATCERGWWGFSATASLRVRTGTGLTKEYQGLEKYGTAYQTTAGFENAMVRCVEQLLNDKEIIGYLEK